MPSQPFFDTVCNELTINGISEIKIATSKIDDSAISFPIDVVFRTGTILTEIIGVDDEVNQTLTIGRETMNYIKPRPLNASIVEEEVEDRRGRYYRASMNLQFSSINLFNNNQIKDFLFVDSGEFAIANCVVIIRDNNGIDWIIGYDLPVIIEVFEANTGGDDNFYTINLVSNSYGRIRRFDYVDESQYIQFIKPNAPSNLILNQVISLDEFNFNWNDNSDNELGFELQYRINNGAWVSLPNLSANTTSLLNETISINNGNTVRARIRAFNSAGNSAWVESNIVTVAIVPDAPSNVVLSQDGILNSFDTTWTDNSIDETGFDIQYQIDTFPWINWGSVGANVTSLNNQVADNLVVGDSIKARVRATNSAGGSEWVTGNTINITALIPLAPSSVVLSQNGSINSFDITWTDNSNNETGFDIEYRLGTSGIVPWQTLGSVGANVTAFNNQSINGVTNGGNVMVRVRATGSDGNSAWIESNVVNVSLPMPNAPSSVVLSQDGTTNSFDVEWNDNSTDETGFEIEYQINSGSWTTWGSVGANVEVFLNQSITGAQNGNNLKARVRATGASLDSAWVESNNITISLPIPNAPSAFSISEIFTGEIAGDFTDNSNIETGYRIQYSINSGLFATQQTLPDYSGTGTRFINSFNASLLGASNGDTFQMRIQALGINGNSVYVLSNTVTLVNQ